MAFNVTSQPGEYHYLVEFVLDSSSFYYADQDLSIQRANNVSGIFYEGRLAEQGSIRRQLDSFLEPKETYQTFVVDLDNRDGEIGRLTGRHTFANRQVKIKLGEGKSLGNYSEVFSGIVAFPNGIAWDEDRASITVVDQRLKSRRILPGGNDVFSVDTYTNVATAAKGEPIPIIYGDWASNASTGLRVPAFCIDTSVPKFKISGHGVKGIDKYYKNAQILDAVADIVNIDLTDGTFELNGVAYDSGSDVVSVNCQGLETINGTLIEAAGDTIQHLLTAYMELTADSLSITAIRGVNEDLDFKLRRHISSRTSTEVLLSELLSEAGVDMRFVNGKYSPLARLTSPGVNNVQYRADDIALVDIQSERAEYSVVKDPERFYANQISSNFRFDPVNVVYDGEYAKTATTQSENVSAIVSRDWDMQWIHRDIDGETRVRRDLVQFSTEPNAVNIRLTNRAMLLNLADKFDLHYDIFNGRTFQVRSMETDLSDMTTRVTGYDFFSETFGVWSNDTAPVWTSSSEKNKQDSGYWSDADGYANPPDSDSLDVSRWE